MSRQTKVKIIREYLNNTDDQPEELARISATKTTSKSGTTVPSETNEIRINQKPMKINVVKEHTRNQNNNQIVATGKDGEPASFSDMQEKMEVELEKRRRDWEKDVMKMQKEFFKMPAGALKEGEDTGNGNPIAIHSTNLPSCTGTEILDISNTKDLYTYKPDGSRVYNLRFNVKGFQPNEVNVKAEGKKLIVSAKHEEEKDSGQKSARNFNRQMDIPAGVIIDDLNAELSTDGILSIEAPVNEAEAEQGNPIITNIKDLGNIGNFDQTESFTVGDPFTAVRQHMPGFTPNYNVESESSSYGAGPESAFSAISYEHNHGYPGHTCHTASRPKMSHFGHANPPYIEEVNELARKLKLEVDIGADYEPDEVNVEIDGPHIHVKAMHEQKTPSGRTAKREYTRTFECPEKIDTSTMRAVLGPDGRLVVGASLTSNKDHHAALESIKQDMPLGGRPVNVF